MIEKLFKTPENWSQVVLQTAFAAVLFAFMAWALPFVGWFLAGLGTVAVALGGVISVVKNQSN